MEQIKHVFIDWSEVVAGYGFQLQGYTPLNASPYGIEIRAHKPTTESVPVLTADQPWESRLGVYSTLLRVGDTWRLYYETWSRDYNGSYYRLCVAFSDDGIHFTKPSLGICSYEGSTDNNILVECHGLVHGFTVLYEPDAPADERFKMIHTDRSAFDTVLTVSEDGLHFSPRGKICTGGDTQSSFFKDPNTGKYVIYTKQCDQNGPARRTIVRMEGDTPCALSAPEVMLYTNPCDPPDMDYYTSSCHVWPDAPHAYVMFPAFFYHTSDLVNLQMLVSRDSKTWYRPLPDAWIDHNDTRKTLYAGNGFGSDGQGHWWLIYCENTHGHNNNSGCSSTLHRAIMREDGFTSLHAESHGAFCTKGYTITENSRLTLNADIQPGGELRVSVVDTINSAPLPGFSADECKLEQIDAVHQSVSWSAPLASIAGQNVLLKFEMFKTDLYSYVF